MKTQFGKRPFGKAASGFTLIELVVTVAVLAILLTVGVPQMGTMLSSNRATAHYNKVVTSLNLARTEAVKRNEPTRVCAGNTAACTSNNWGNGWVVLTDDDTILDYVDPLGGGFTLALADGGSGTGIQYRPNGTLTGNAGVTFLLCDDTGEDNRAKAVNVNLMGQPSQAKDNTGNDIVEDVNGNDVSCP